MVRRFVAAFIIVTAGLLGACQGQNAVLVTVPARDAPFPATWTPTLLIERTSTATLVVRPEPTWDGTPPPPSESFVPRISSGELALAIRDKERVIVIDGRALAAYQQAHISGALHIPFPELPARSHELDANALVVLYTWSQTDAEGLEAAMALYGIGFAQVAMLEGGIQVWHASGYPTEGTILTPTPELVGPPWTVEPLTPPSVSVTGTVTIAVGLESSSKPTATVAATE